jgi:prepilin-type processing-associated H-X9-DG protein
MVLASATMAAGSSPAQELTKRLPDGVAGFVATSGGDALQGDFAQTALGRIWNDPGVRSFYGAIKEELLAKAKAQAKDPNATRTADMAMQYARLILSRPLVVGVLPVPGAKDVPICAFAIVDAGDRKAELAAALGKLEALAGPDGIADRTVGSFPMHGAQDTEPPLYWGWVENYLVLAWNDGQGVVPKYVAAPRATTFAPLDKVPAGADALVTYFDYRQLGNLLAASHALNGGEKQAEKIKAVFQATGLSDLKTLAARIGFAGTDVVARAVVETPVPPVGVFKVCQPVNPAWFGAVDPRAVTATAVNLDVTSLYDLVLDAVKTVSPDEGYLALRQAIVDFEFEAKLRLRDGLLASLAGPALFYTLPAGPLAEAPRGGVVVVAKLKDVSLFEKTMSALGTYVADRSKGALQVAAQTRDDGRTVHVWAIAPLAMMGAMPAWSMAKDHVVIGSTPELCDLGVRQLVSRGADGKSLLDAQGYRKVTAGLPENLMSLSYTDSRVQLQQFMAQLQQIWPLATMGAMQAGIKLPVMLPSLADIAKDLGPSCSYRYFGPDGLHVYYRGPGIEASQMTIVGGAVAAAIAMPALQKSREQARSAVSMSHLKQLGFALLKYADDHQGEWPADLEQVKPYLGDSPAQVLESPRKPKGFQGPSYVYVGGRPKDLDQRNVVVYENPAFSTDKINVLFADGHVEAMKPEAFRQALQATCERLGREMPEIRFKGEKGSPPPAPKAPAPGKSAREAV